MAPNREQVTVSVLDCGILALACLVTYWLAIRAADPRGGSADW
jgi:hypothetical protein